MSHVGANHTMPTAGQRARLLVGAGEFGWGSAGKLRLVLDRLPELDAVIIGSELGSELLLDHGVMIHEMPQTAADAGQLLDDLRMDAALVVGEPVLAERLVAAGCPVVFLDSLPFLWTENDPVAVNADTYCAQRREAWGAQMLDDSRSTRLDFEDVTACDVFVATPGARPASAGTHIEIGWASALGKKIILLIQDEREYAALVTGLPSVADVTFVPFTFGRPVARAVSRIIDEFAAGPAESSESTRRQP